MDMKPSSNPTDGPVHPPIQRPARPAGVSIEAGQDAKIENSQVIGGDYNHQQTTNNQTTNNHRTTKNTRVKVGLGSLAVLLVFGGGAWGLSKAFSSSTDVVYETGTQGAVDTLSQIKKAEQDSNAERWCFLSSSTSGSTCRSMMANSFSAVAANLRAQIQDVTVGSPSGGGNALQIPISLQGGAGGDVMLQWTGKRWELNRTMYLLAINNGGIFMTAVANAHHCAAVAGVLMSCQ